MFLTISQKMNNHKIEKYKNIMNQNDILINSFNTFLTNNIINSFIIYF